MHLSMGVWHTVMWVFKVLCLCTDIVGIWTHGAIGVQVSVSGCLHTHTHAHTVMRMFRCCMHASVSGCFHTHIVLGMHLSLDVWTHTQCFGC